MTLGKIMVPISPENLFVAAFSSLRIDRLFAAFILWLALMSEAMQQYWPPPTRQQSEFSLFTGRKEASL